jgi:hypothetical protein
MTAAELLAAARGSPGRNGPFLPDAVGLPPDTCELLPSSDGLASLPRVTEADPWHRRQLVVAEQEKVILPDVVDRGIAAGVIVRKEVDQAEGTYALLRARLLWP